MADRRSPRILISSVGCWNDTVGADTYSALFEGYEASKIANLYIREEMPNSSVCQRYYKISESRVIRSLVDRRVQTGRELFGNGPMVADAADMQALRDSKTRYERLRRNRSWILLYARELIWKLGRWRTPELDAFIDGFCPEIVMFGMEGYVHFNRINRYIVKRTGAKAVGYFYDDNFTYEQHPWSIGYRIYRFFQRRDLRKTAKVCAAFFAISPKTQRECDAFFGIQSVLLTKPARFASENWVPYNAHSPVKMLYTGNLLYGRIQSIELLGEAMHRMNSQGVKVVLDVYTTTDVSEKEARRLDSAICLHTRVPQDEILELQKRADVLVFVEDLSGPNRRVARLSFSTKLTDYLQSGKCVFAIGAPDIAPIEYLRSEDAAICATSEGDVFRELQSLVENPALISAYGRRAYECARRNHEELNIRQRLYDTIHSVIDGCP